MAEQNGNTPAPWKLDLAAFPRKHAGVVTLPGEKGKPTEYKVWGVLDLKPDECIKVLALEEEIGAPGKTFKEQMELGLQQVLILAPDIPAHVAAAIPPSALLQLRRKALGYDAANPQPAEVGTTTATPSADSSASSPARPSSSAGPTGS